MQNDRKLTDLNLLTSLLSSDVFYAVRPTDVVDPSRQIDAASLAAAMLSMHGEPGRTSTITVAPVGGKADFVCASATDNQVEINEAITAAASVTNGADVYLRAGGLYTVSAPVIAKSNVRLIAETGAWLRMTINDYIIQGSASAISDFVMENLTFVGTGTTAGAKGGVYLDGSLDPNMPGAPIIANITMRNCNVRNCTSLPIKLFGVSGKCMVGGSEFTSCLDAGFIHDDEVIFLGNHSYGSGDNGFSISRGCNKVTCVANTVENPFFHGVWLGGFNGEAGPSELTCAGNTVKNARYSGIYLGGSPTKGAVTGNFVDNNHNRPIDSADGIQIYGDNSSQFANILNVSGNTILNSARAGVSLYQGQNVLVSSNLIIDPGTQFKADGTTAISASDTTTNAGFLTTNLGSYTNVWVNGNAVYDTRGTPYCNWDFWKVGTTGINYGLNESSGMRNASQLNFRIDKASSNQLPMFKLTGGMYLKRTPISDASYTIVATDYTVAFTLLTAGRVATLPSAAAVPNQIIIISDEHGSAATNNITIAPVASQKVDGASSLVITKNYGYVSLYSTGTAWKITGGNY